MKKITQLEIDKILEDHKLWLEDNSNGAQADLSYIDLHGIKFINRDLRNINFQSSDLCYARFFGCDLRNSNLTGANLYKSEIDDSNFERSILTRACLSYAGVSKSCFNHACFRRSVLNNTYFFKSDLIGADFTCSELYKADFRGSDLKFADFNNANITFANLWYTNATQAKHLSCPLSCPEKGSFIGFKKAFNDSEACLVELLIPDDALRSSSTSRQCRCSKAKVISITSISTGLKLNKAYSFRNPSFEYVVEKIVESPSFDTDRWNECSSGIHFFMTKEEAISYLKGAL